VLTSLSEFHIIFNMAGNKRRRVAPYVLAFILFAVTFVQFCHTETSVFESKPCPVCQLNCASIGVAQVSSVFVFYCVLIEMLAPVDTPLSVSSHIDARVSRAPPLS
jgi:hypothetical protein